MKLFVVLIILIVTLNLESQNNSRLDINHVKASIGINGSLFNYYLAGSNLGLESPIGSGKSWCDIGNIWISGFDGLGYLRLAAGKHEFEGRDYAPGPLSTVTADTYEQTVTKYAKVWKINKTDIEQLIINFQNGNLQSGIYSPNTNILTWPGNGDISLNHSAGLAPFFDYNNDGIYNVFDGDYPIIKGDQAIYTIFNDNYYQHSLTGARPLGVEIHLMAYAIGDCGYSDGVNSVLKYTTFYNYKIFNRSTNTYNNVNISHYNNANIGDKTLNKTGCNVQGKYGYTYDYSDTVLYNTPYLATVLLKGVSSNNDEIDNDNNGLIDEPGEQLGMTGYMYFNASFPSTNSSQSDPQNGAQYYQYMKNIWRDGTPLTCGGNGYGGNVQTSYAFSGNTYTNGVCGNTNWIETGNGSDKQMLLNSGGFNFLPGEMKEVEYAYVLCFDSINRNHYNKLEAEVTQLHQLYSNGLGACNATSLQERSINNTCKVFPNPTTDFIELNCSGKKVTSVFITNVLGEIVKKQDANSDKIDLSELVPGIYFVSFLVDKSSSIIKVIKH